MGHAATRGKAGTAVRGATALALVGFVVGAAPVLGQTCEPAQPCGDVDDSGAVLASDALKVLKKAVGQDLALTCECAGGAGNCESDLATCQADLASCLAVPVCGDGAIEAGEDCDFEDLGDETCVSRGFGGGMLSCSFCSFDTSACYESRFDAAGATIIDHQTGLEWEKKDAADSTPDPANPHDADNLYTWCAGPFPNCLHPNQPFDGTAATDFLAVLNGAPNGVCYLGHCDWRLPSLDELLTIISTPPCVDSCVIDPVFEPTRAGYYATSITYGNTPSFAQAVNLILGQPAPNAKANSLPVRAVRTLP